MSIFAAPGTPLKFKKEGGVINNNGEGVTKIKDEPDDMSDFKFEDGLNVKREDNLSVKHEDGIKKEEPKEGNNDSQIFVNMSTSIPIFFRIQ